MPSQQRIWSDANLTDPHAMADKAQRVRRMFAAIAPTYDLNNRLHSLGRDQAWRAAAVKLAHIKPGERVVDVACGTGDLTLGFARGGADVVLGIDFTYDMLTIAQKKAARCSATRTHYQAGDALRLPLGGATADVISIAFGIRNVADPAMALIEFVRVLRPGGRLIILEFAMPQQPLLRRLYRFYFEHILPRTAGLIARDRSGAYRYLPRSVSTFIDGPRMLAMMQEAGLEQTVKRSLTCGVAALYRGVKPSENQALSANEPQP